MLQKKTTLTYGYDVASAIAALMCNPLALGEAFHITQDLDLSWQEVLNIYLDTFVQSGMTPPQLVMVDLKTFHQIYYYGKYQVNYDRMYDRVFDTSKIKQFIDTQNFINPEVGLRRCLTAIIQSRDFQHEDYLISVRMDKVAHETRPLREFSSIKTKAKYLIRRYILK